jgi:hypothetical protein
MTEENDTHDTFLAKMQKKNYDILVTLVLVLVILFSVLLSLSEPAEPINCDIPNRGNFCMDGFTDPEWRQKCCNP